MKTLAKHFGLGVEP